VSRKDWEIRFRIEQRSGTYYVLNIRNANGSVVMVKARAKVGPPYVCLTCKLNECEHTKYVSEVDTSDVRDAPRVTPETGGLYCDSAPEDAVSETVSDTPAA
jgi:hypothetical protein